MNKIENLGPVYSSAHDDELTPMHDKAQAEYHPIKGYPNRYDDLGPKGERSVIQRISQFGITEGDIAKLGIDNLLSITTQQYDQLIREAIQQNYETAFTSIFDHWEKMTPEAQRSHIRNMAKRYQNWGFNLLQRGKSNNDSPNMVISLEGADAVRKIEHVRELSDLGVGCVAPQYNIENAIADQDGLTVFGRECINEMLRLGIIIDLAHSTPNVRRDIMDMIEDHIQKKGNSDAGKYLMYTHGATAEDINEDHQFSKASEKRGLAESEVKRIIQLGGMIGLGVTRPFFQSVEAIVDRIDKMCQVEPENGPQSLVIGSDFGGVAPEWMVGIEKPADFSKIADGLSQRFGYNDSQIDDILRKNLTRRVEEIKLNNESINTDES